MQIHNFNASSSIALHENTYFNCFLFNHFKSKYVFLNASSSIMLNVNTYFQKHLLQYP